MTKLKRAEAEQREQLKKLGLEKKKLLMHQICRKD